MLKNRLRHDDAAMNGAGVTFITHPVFLASGFGPHHPLSIVRQRAVLDLCRHLGWLSAEQMLECPLATRAELSCFHDSQYLDALEHAERLRLASPTVRSRFNLGTMECPLFDGLLERARATVGGAIVAAQRVADGGIAFHPAGGTHHGRRDRAAGFCYFNDPVFAVLTLLKQGAARVLYVDLDAHHGDAVQDAFSGHPRVVTVSIHEAGRWPGTGALADRGGGNARNLPVPRDCNDSEFRFLMREAVVPIGQQFAPEAVVVTCGVDALKGDPLSTMQLANRTLWDAVLALVALAPRAVVLGGGGYNPWTLARGWAGLWGCLNGFQLPEQLPPASKALLAGLDCDLVDPADRLPEWLDTLVDEANDGPIRAQFTAIVRAVLA